MESAQGVTPIASRRIIDRVLRSLRFERNRHSSIVLLMVCLGLISNGSTWAADGPVRKAGGARRASRRGSGSATEPGSTGEADSSVTLIEFSDFECPYCAQMATTLGDVQRAFPGKIHVVVKDFPLYFHPHSELAHEAALAAKAQGKYWEMYRLLFANQHHLEKPDLIKYAQQLHLNVDEFQKALETHTYRAQVRESLAEGKALGVSATPTFFLNGQKFTGVQSFDTLSTRVQAALGGTAATVAATREQEHAAAPDTLLASAPVRGSPAAPVTIVEFADFQCPYCAQAHTAVDQVLQEYPSSVKVVFKSFPLDFHQDAMLAHKAAMAAGQQGKFWEMHDEIFSHQRTIKRDDLLGFAKSLGLDMGRFQKDLENETLQSQIEAERAEGMRRGVQGTPTFYVDGVEMMGSATASQFEAMIDKALVAKGITPRRTPLAADGGPVRGPEHAPVTVLWYSDVTSPLAVKASQLMDDILKAYPEDVRVVFRNRPLEFHPDAQLAHQALMAAAGQGKFWAMHRILLAHQKALTANDLMDYAGQAGLDTQKFLNDITNQVYREPLQREITQAREAGINGVPAFFINGKRVDGVQTLSEFKAIVDEQIRNSRVAAVRE